MAEGHYKGANSEHLNRREEILQKLLESEDRSARLAYEIEEKRRRLTDMQGRLSSANSAAAESAARAKAEAAKERYNYPKVKVPPPEPELNLEDDPEYQAEMAKIKKQTEEETDRLAKDIQERCRVDMSSKLKDISGQMSNAMDNRLGEINHRYSTHADTAIRGKSTDVLRMNKVIRDLSRSLGPHWKPVFLEIMAGEPQDMVQGKMAEIETQRGFMQAYKALTIWKDTKGDEINMSVLINALRNENLYELAEQTMDTLDAHGEDNLITVTDFGKGIKSASHEREIPQRPMPGDAAANGDEEAAAAAAAAARELRDRLASHASEAEAALSGPLGDRKMLQLARKVGNNWVPLAKALELESSEIQDIYNSEGDTYQGAFKAIFCWRDAMGGNTPANVQKLRAALEKINRNDVLELFN